MKLKTDDEMQELMKGAIGGVLKVLNAEDNLRVPEADDIVDMVYCFFLNNSIESIPKEGRLDYLKKRLLQLSVKVHGSVEDIDGIICPDCKNGTHGKSVHFDA